jgi:hypothetical protein
LRKRNERPNATDVIKTLTRLGGTATRVAASLYKRGVKGRSGDCANCPLSKYLENTYNWAYARVGEHIQLFEIGSDTVVVTVDKEDIPDQIHMFVRKFDEGSYSYLAE